MRWIDARQWGTARNLGSIDGVCSGSDRCQAVNVQSLNAIKCSFDCPALWLPWGIERGRGMAGSGVRSACMLLKDYRGRNSRRERQWHL